MRESIKHKDVRTLLVKEGPIEALSLKNAFRALSRRSFSPLLISPDGVKRKPRYLYERTVSKYVSLKRKRCLFY